MGTIIRRVTIKIATSGTHTLSSTDMERFFADSAEEHIEFYGEDGCGYLVAGAPPQEMTGVSAEGATKTYDGNEYGIHVSLTGDAAGATVTYGTVEGTYNLTESPKIKNVGTQTVYYKVTKEGYKNVTGSATVTINKKELNNAMFPSISAVTYDGSEKEPTVVLSDMAGSRELIQTSDYSISYSNNTAAGTATVTATAEAGGNYTGTASSTFTINPKSLEGAAVVLNQADNKYVQNGSTPIVPEVVTIDGVAMTKGTDYTLSGTTSATAIGAHILTVTGTGNYTGTTTVTWRILDANPPTGRIQIGTMESTEFLHGLSVGIRAKEAQSVTISGADAEELDKVYYYLFEDIYGIIPTEEQVKSLPDSSWTTLPLDANGTGSFIIQPDRAFGIYAKITDKSGNATYINSLGVFLDTTAPVIIGVKDGQSYCGETSVTVKDMTLFKVYLDGDGHNCFNSTYTFDVEPGEQVIKAVDYLGNETEITITVYETHDYGEWITDKEATATAEGMRHKECSHCGQKVVEVIPMIGDTDDGKVKKTVVLNPGAPEATLNNSIDSLRDSDILSQDDKTAMEGAVSATIWLEVTALEEDAVLDDDKSKIKEKARGLGCADTAIHYMDISLFKQLSSALSATQIHEPGTDMSVTIKIPEAIRNTNSSMIRTFYVLRVHGGVCEVVGQGNANTAGDFPFVTNKFSTYAIIYKDSPKPAPAVISPAAATEVKTGTVAKTGDEANLLGWMIAMLLGIVAMAGISVVYYKKKKDKKNEETP